MMTMNSVAVGLSDEDVRDLAFYIASQDACQVNIQIDHRREGFKEAFIAGRDKYRSSNRTHCHATFHHYAPRLIGQKSGHLTKALQQFREGQRRAPMMANLLKSWSSTEYENVVTYSVGYV